MENKPQQPAPLPQDGTVEPDTASHADHGIPPASHDAEPTGTPSSDRHHGEVAPTKP